MITTISEKEIAIKDNIVVRDLMAIDKIKNKKID